MAGAGAGSFGAGFAKGLANVLLSNRQEQTRKAERQQDVDFRNFQTTFPILFRNFQENPTSESAATLEDAIVRINPEMAKQIRRGGFSFETLGPLLSQPTQVTEAVPEVPGATRQVPGGTPTLPATSGAMTQLPDQTVRLFGAPVLSEEQKLIRDFEARRRLADRANLPAEEKPYFALGTTKTAVAGSQSAVGQTYAEGEVTPDPDSPTGWSQTLYLRADPTKRQKIPAPPPTARSSRAVNPTERIAFEMFGRTNEDPRAVMARLTPEQMAVVTERAREEEQATAYARGTGTGQARIETELDMPIGPTAAGLYNVPPTTTLRQLQARVTLRPEQQEKVNSLAQVDDLLTQISTLLPKVYPEVEPGMWGRVQTQFSLGAQTLGASEDMAALDAAINAALAQVAQLSGQPGSRLSDRDVELAKSTLGELTPRVFGGDTLRTARARLGVLRRLLEKAQSAIPTQGTAVGAPGTGRGTTTTPPSAGDQVPGAVMRDGKLYINGVEYPQAR